MNKDIKERKTIMAKIKTEDIIWNVYWYDFNEKTIEKRNIFNLSTKFYKGFEKIRKEVKKHNFEWFNLELRKLAQCCYWSKVEYEILATDVFASVEKEKMLENYLNTKGEWIQPLCNFLKTREKIDIFEQLELNWDAFSNYVYYMITTPLGTLKKRGHINE